MSRAERLRLRLVLPVDTTPPDLGAVSAVARGGQEWCELGDITAVAIRNQQLIVTLDLPEGAGVQITGVAHDD